MSSEKRITPKRKSIELADKEAIWGWILVSAWIAGFFIFLVGALALSLVMSFFKPNMITQLKFLQEEKENVLNLHEGNLKGCSGEKI